MQDLQTGVVASAPYPPAALQQVGQLGPRDVREAFAQGRHADAQAKLVNDRQHFAALGGRRAEHPAAQRRGAEIELPVLEVCLLAPVAQGPWA